MTAHKEYTRLVYRRAILSAVRKFVAEHISLDVPAKNLIRVEGLLLPSSTVPEEELLSFLEELVEEDAVTSRALRAFEVRKREAALVEPEDEESGSLPSEESYEGDSQDELHGIQWGA